MGKHRNRAVRAVVTVCWDIRICRARARFLALGGALKGNLNTHHGGEGGGALVGYRKGGKCMKRMKQGKRVHEIYYLTDLIDLKRAIFTSLFAPVSF